ncbi:MAG: helix-turn-helix domain-containing protein [Prevotella sp.]|jgi:AraC-like DNA-binding protein|nr:helix-turn-helix domain-containing protein [Prevotella sp.]
MNKQEDKYSRITLEDISDKATISVIENFIISDGYKEYPNISFEHPYILDGVAFMICLNGIGKMKINLREYHIEKNSIITFFPGSIIELQEKSDDFLMEYLFFSFDFLSDLKIPANSDIALKIEQTPCVKINEEKKQILLDYHSFIAKQYKRNEQLYKEEIAKNLLGALMIEVSSIYIECRDNEISSTTRKEEIFNQFIKLLFKHHREERSISFYADKLCLTPKYLAQIIKKVSGKPTLDWITEITILSIKAMLKSSSYTVMQISEDLNFPNPSFFGRFFKKHTGLTPMQYRES